MHGGMIDGLPREKINTTANLKDMVISQLQVIYDKRWTTELMSYHDGYNKFDVDFGKHEKHYFAQAIVYKTRYDSKTGGVKEHLDYKVLEQVFSEDGSLNALDKLWGGLARKVPVHRIDGVIHNSDL